MRAAHQRLPKNFVLEERLERYADRIEICPSRYKGLWAHACYPLEVDAPSDAAAAHSYQEVWLDLGCGRGSFVVELARANPSVLVIGIDFDPVSVAYTAQHITEAGLMNALALGSSGDKICALFGQSELSRIYLNFSTPFPRKKEAADRLTTPQRLKDYAHMLAPGGYIQLRTDSQPFYDWTREMLDAMSYSTLAAVDDCYGDASWGPTTEYAERLRKQGAKVFGIKATPTEASLEKRADQMPDPRVSLQDYLPDDLSQMSYIPLGMEGTVQNLINQKKKLERKLKKRT